MQDTLEEIHERSANEDSKSDSKFIGKEELKYLNLNDLKSYLRDFEDELTLDKLSRNHILQLCKLLSLPSVGPLSFLRFQLRLKAKLIKDDDKVILFGAFNVPKP